MSNYKLIPLTAEKYQEMLKIGGMHFSHHFWYKVMDDVLSIYSGFIYHSSTY